MPHENTGVAHHFRMERPEMVCDTKAGANKEKAATRAACLPG